MRAGLGMLSHLRGGERFPLSGGDDSDLVTVELPLIFKP
jgi:hypothetical protein